VKEQHFALGTVMITFQGDFMMGDDVIPSGMLCRWEPCWDQTILMKLYTFLLLFWRGIEEVKD